MSAAAPTTGLGRLFLVPAPLDFGCEERSPLDAVLPRATLEQAAQLSCWVCENAKSLRAYLKRVDALHPLATPLQQQQVAELPRHIHKKGDHPGSAAGPASAATALLAPLLAGQDMGLVSEAGMPAVADPGSSIVRAAHDMGAQVVPLVGPVSVLLALAASGLNGQSFAFHGYLPQDSEARSQRMRQLETTSHKTGQAQLFIETPYRNQKLADDILLHCKPQTKLCIAMNISCDDELILTRSVKAWKGKLPDMHKKPTVFLLYKG